MYFKKYNNIAVNCLVTQANSHMELCVYEQQNNSTERHLDVICLQNILVQEQQTSLTACMNFSFSVVVYSTFIIILYQEMKYSQELYANYKQCILEMLLL